MDSDGIDSRIVKVRRISRMFKGGRRMRFSAMVIVGDREGRIGIATAKGKDVAQAQIKATAKAKRSMVQIPLKGNTIPHQVTMKFKATTLLIRPAAPGTGIVAGVTVKSVLELVGVKDALSKIMGSSNAINSAYATVEALKYLRGTRL